MSGRPRRPPIVMRKPRPGVGGQQFRGHEVGPAVSQGKLQGAEHHGKGGRDAELRENLPVVGAICAGPSG